MSHSNVAKSGRVFILKARRCAKLVAKLDETPSEIILEDIRRLHALVTLARIGARGRGTVYVANERGSR